MQAINVLTHNIVDFALLHQLQDGHVSDRGNSIIKRDVDFGLDSLLFQSPDTIWSSEKRGGSLFW